MEVTEALEHRAIRAGRTEKVEVKSEQGLEGRKESTVRAKVRRLVGMVRVSGGVDIRMFRISKEASVVKPS